MRGVLLQVRLDSTRLPEKALLDIKGYKLIEHAMRALKKVDAQHYILVTTEDSYNKLEPLADKWGFSVFTGSKENVLERFIKAIEKYGLKQIVRATGDNPLVSFELANMLIKKHNMGKFDYSGFMNNPIGTGVEVVNTSALVKSFKETESMYDKEHVTPYIYKNPNIFKVFQMDAPEQFILHNSYVTVDTEEDFNRIEKLYNDIYCGEIISLESVINWLKKEQLSYIPT